MRRLSIVTAGVAALALVTTSLPVRASGDGSETFDGNEGAPDLRGNAAHREVDGSRTEQRVARHGEWKVGPSGNLSWTRTLEVVPGIDGVQPALAIRYDSHDANGLLGQGISLTGLPAIVRVPGTGNGASGGEPRGVQFDAHDTFAVAPGGWGSPVSPRGKLVPSFTGASTYHTAIESWEQFIPYGHCGAAGFAPCVWVAEDGEGNTYYYGASDEGRLWERNAGQDDEGTPVANRGVAAWALTHFRDQHGNVYRVDYHNDGMMLYPQRIEYGCQMVVDPGPFSTPPGEPPTGGDPTTPPIWVDPAIDTEHSFVIDANPEAQTGPFIDVALVPPTAGVTVTINEDEEVTPLCPGVRSVEFEYETRTEFTALPARRTMRLLSATMRAQGTPVRRYGFEYEPDLSPLGQRTRLRAIHEYGNDLTTEYPPTVLSWSEGKSIDKTGQQQIGWPLDADERVLTLAGDVDGDGKDDVVRVSLGNDRRRVAWALGRSDALEWGQAPLGPISTPLDSGGDHTQWSATMADVDADGRDDLLLWTIDGGQGEIDIYTGTTGGLSAAVSYPHNADVAAFAAIASRDKEDYRLVVADLNGDQIDDIALLNQHPDDTDRVAFALGSTGGLGALEQRGGAGLEVIDYPAWLEPVVSDVDGDGLQDIIFSYSRITGITTQIFRGNVEGLSNATVVAWSNTMEASLCPVTCGVRSECACTGGTPFQVLTSDANGDGIGDLTLAYTGASTPMSNSDPIPFGRNFQTWLGQTNLSQLPVDSAGRRSDAGKYVSLDPATYPARDFGTPNYAHWEHHAGDVNGDGISDVVAFYGGVAGLRAGYALGTLDGELGPMLPITSCAVSSSDPNWGAACAVLPDGDANRHTWHSLVVDFDQDGYADLLRYYAGQDGQFVEIARGGPGGLDTFAPLLTDAAIAEGPLHDLDRARSVSLLAPDINGDGRRDLVLASQAEIVVLPTEPGSPTEVGLPDLLVQIDNGQGGTTQFDYEMASRLPNAIDPTTAACGQASGTDCGMPQTAPRPLATRVVERDGRGGVYGIRYAYTNGRYYPGPVVVGGATGQAHTRADLAFESVEETDELSGRVTTTHYHQDPELKRLPYLIEQQDWFYPLSAAPPVLLTSSREERTYTKSASPFATRKIELTGKALYDYEWGSKSRTLEHEYEYDSFGGLWRHTECADGTCMETVQAYFGPSLAPGSYRVARLKSRKTRNMDYNDAISWERHQYTNDNLTRVEKLLCDDSEQCDCFADDDAETCIANDWGRWVAVEHGHQYDGWGNLLARTDAIGHQSRFEYDGTYHTYLTAAESTVLDAAGVSRTMRTETTYNDDGTMATETDLNGRVTTLTYDVLGRKWRVEHPNGREEHWDYENDGDPTQQLVRYRELVDLTQGTERWEERYFDGLGRVHMIRDSAEGRVLVRRWREYYDDRHLVTQQSDPYFEDDPGQVGWTEKIYDPRARLIRVDRVADALPGGGGTFLGTRMTRRYFADGYYTEENAAPTNDDGAILGTDNRWTAHTFDSRGNVLSVEQQGTDVTYFYDDALRLGMVWGRHASNSLGPIMAETFVAYDYDSFGRIQIANDSEGWTLFDYDDNGNITMADDANGDTVWWTYDGLGRVLSRSSSAGVEAYTYDARPGGVGELGSVAGPWGSEVITAGFDDAGNPLSRTLTLAGLPSAQTEQYSYDLSGRITDKILPDGTVLHYQYDSVGRLRAVEIDGVQYLELDQYDANANPGVRITPASFTSYEYNGDHRLLSLLTEPSGGGDALIDLTYSYDAVGNVLGIVDNRSDTMVDSIDTNETWSFGYDNLDQLTSATDADGLTRTYAYDPESNMVRKGDLFFEFTATQMVAHQGAMTGPVVSVATHDPMGRVVHKSDDGGAWDYTYDPHGRLTSIELDGDARSQHLYDTFGRRVRKSEVVDGDTITTWYVSPNYELRSHSNDPGSLVATRIVDGQGNGVVATLTDDQLDGAPDANDVYAAAYDAIGPGHVGGAPGGIWFHHQNHVESTAVVTDEEGVAVSRYRNSPWGDRIEGSVGFDVAFREFGGQVRDEHVGLVYFGARYYDPVFGRFTTPDMDDYGRPLYPNTERDVGQLNRHVYVRNNPVRYIDPSGHSDQVPQLIRDMQSLGDNYITEYKGETMTVKEALARIEKEHAPKPGVMDWVREKWKGVRGKDADVDFKLKVNINFKQILGLDQDDNISVKGDNTTITEKGATYKPPVTVDAGAFTASGSVTVTKDGVIKTNTTAGVGKSFAKDKVTLKAEATMETTFLGDGKAKIQPGAQVVGRFKPTESVDISLNAVVKDGSRVVDVPEVPDVEVRIHPNLAPALNPEVRLQSQRP